MTKHASQKLIPAPPGDIFRKKNKIIIRCAYRMLGDVTKFGDASSFMEYTASENLKVVYLHHPLDEY